MLGSGFPAGLAVGGKPTLGPSHCSPPPTSLGQRGGLGLLHTPLSSLGGEGGRRQELEKPQDRISPD